MSSKALSILMLFVLSLSAACATSAAPASPSAVPTHASQNLTVLAAASLTESFTEIGHAFEAQNPGVKVSFSFAGSQQLAQQLAQGVGADVFASANVKYMDAMFEAGRVKSGDAETFAKNRLVVIFPKYNPAAMKALKDLAKPGLKLDLADPSVPVGQYTLKFLDKAVEDPRFGSAFKNAVLKNVVSYEDNVKAVVTKVALGEADAGVVYATDVTPDVAAKITKLAIPDSLNTIATYPIAPISDSHNPALARAFVSYVLSPAGQAILKKYGFIPVTAAVAP